MGGRRGPQAPWPVQPDVAARAASGVLPTPRGHAEDEAPGAPQLWLPPGALRGTRGEVVLTLHGEDFGLEGSIASPPKAHSQGCISPSNLDLHRWQLDRRVAAVQERVAQEADVPLAQGRLALLGLALVASVRALSWWEGTQPGYSTFSMHFLTTTSDLACLMCALPLFAMGTQGQCVTMGLLGPMLTLVFAMSALDTCALGAYLVIATPRPLESNRSLFEELEASLGVWEFALLASVALQMSLCAATWRVYKELRSTGLYPPGSNPAAVGRMREVPFMEVMCETEDMELITECISPYAELLAPAVLLRGDQPLPPSVKAPLLECGGPATPSTALADAESRWSPPSSSESFTSPSSSPRAPAWTPRRSPAAPAPAWAEAPGASPELAAWRAYSPRTAPTSTAAAFGDLPMVLRENTF